MEALAWRFDLHVLRLYRLDLDGLGESARRSDGIEVRLAASDELIAATEDPAMELSSPSIASALDRGDLCVGAFEQDRLVGYMWVAFGDSPQVGGIWGTIPGDAMWWYKVFVDAKCRGRRIAGSLYGFRHPAFAAKGPRHVLLGIATHNHPSISAAMRAGFRTVGVVAYWHKGDRFVALHSRGARRSGFRLFLPR